MTELAGALWLLVGLGGLLAAATLAACCLRLRSATEYLLAVYVLAWSWLVWVTLALSPPKLVTRGWLLAGIGLGLALALAVWLALGRPAPPPFGPALRSLRDALRNRYVLVLAIAVSAGFLYSVALALFTPVNEWDALTYQLARAAFWIQAQGLGYVASSVDVRLDANPPNAEIGNLATMLLARSDRFVALPQLLAYLVLVVCVAGLARRIGLDMPQAVFGALAFATLPVVILQASAALNDLVVASFLACAVVFALGTGVAPLVLGALALGLAVSTKFTAVLALPALAVVVATGRPRRAWPALALAGLAGIALGSTWYVVNLVETGLLDGGLAEAWSQRPDGASHIAVGAMLLALGPLDMSGAEWPFVLVFVGAAVALALGAIVEGRAGRDHSTLLRASLLTASVLLVPLAFALWRLAADGGRGVLGHVSEIEWLQAQRLGTVADPAHSWFGPLGVLGIGAGSVACVVLWRRGRIAAVTLAAALSPWLLFATLALTIIWHPGRGRFLVIAVALAAATWGLWLTFRAVAVAIVAIGSTTVVLVLANHSGKPSGIETLVAGGGKDHRSVELVWTASRADVQALKHPDRGMRGVFELVEDRVSEDAVIAIAPRVDEYLYPYFGPRLERDVRLVPRGARPPADTEWLVLAPTRNVPRCRVSWRRELALETGWRIERRIAPDSC